MIDTMILPSSVDLRPQVSSVDAQGSYGTCVPFAKLKGLSVLYERDGKKVDLSEPYLYHYARKLANTLNQEGSSPELANVVLKTRGCCLDASFPYTPENLAMVPPASLDWEAALYKITSYATMNWFQDPMYWVKKHLAEGKPVNVMIHISGDFDEKAGLATNWRETDWTPSAVTRGDHEVVIIGYDDAAQRFLLQNSWGPGWADGGFFGMTYANFMNPFCASLVDCITGFNGVLHPAPYPKGQIVEWYTAVHMIADDGGVAYWGDPENGGLDAFCNSVVDATDDNVRALKAKYASLP